MALRSCVRCITLGGYNRYFVLNILALFWTFKFWFCDLTLFNTVSFGWSDFRVVNVVYHEMAIQEEFE